MQSRQTSTTWTFFLTLCLAIHAVPAVARETRPNIVIIVGDDMGYADIGVHGGREIPTPHIDALAAAGVRCTNGYVSGPYCSPTRAALLTGRYQTRFGHEFNPGAPGAGLPLTEVTLADRLKEAGYVTGLVGKWHLGGREPQRPTNRGFDEFFGFLGGAHSYFAGQAAPIYRNNDPITEEEYLTDAFAREAALFIDRHRDEPFFLYLAFNAVHTPMQATEARLKEFEAIADPKRRKYAAMMAAMDEAIGSVLEKLAHHGLEENTLVFFISDNGGPTMNGTSRNASRNEPLRGSKRTTLEGGIRVPFFVKWPARLPAGQVYDKPVIQLDFLPTALAAAGVQIEPQWKADGVDLVPFLSGQNEGVPHERLYWRLGPQMAIRQGDWKLVRYDPTVDGAQGRATPPRLYNLAADPGEANDRYADQPQKAKELQAAWDEWNKENVEPLWSQAKARRQAPGAKRRARPPANASR
jgi:arylsulfatase A-like enzyme